METEEITIFEHSGVNVVDDENFEANPRVSFSNEEQSGFTEKLSDWSDICRVCASTNDHIIPIFEAEGAEHELSDKIHRYLPIRVSQTDTLPLQLCYHCAATILAWHELLDGCLDAEKQLLQMQTEQSTNDNTEKKYMEISSEELIDDPEPITIEKQDSITTNQQDEEPKDCNIGEEPIERSDRVTETFSVFLDKQNIYRTTRRIKNDIEAEKFDERGENTNWQEISPTRDENNEDTRIKKKRDQKKKNLRQIDDDDDDENTLQSVNSYNEISSKESSPIERKCIIRCEEFDKVNDLQESIEDNRNLSNVIKSYKCAECSKIFRLRDSLLRHERIHSDERPFTCHVCGKQFRVSGGLSRHLKHVHAKLKNFQCDICNISFSSKATRDDHRRIHTGERPYNCEICNKSFKSRACLHMHNKLHKNEFPYPCGHCEKKFRRRHEMIVHVSCHTGEKNYSCDICFRRFRVKTEVTRHRLTHSNEKPYVCAKCGLSFRQNRYLNNHVKSKHS